MTNYKSFQAQINEKFGLLFSSKPRIFQAPGRVNLIGEHTDYNDGFVFPIALERRTTAAMIRRDDRKLEIWSENMGESIAIDLNDNSSKRNHWSDYVAGVAAIMEKSGMTLSGANIYLESDVPVGSGLSSSAALEVSTALGLAAIHGIEIDKISLAKLCQRAENEFVGMKCGIMDQFIACHGEHNKALLLDCRSLDFQMIELPLQNALFVVCNTMVKHELGASEYNKRRSECEEAVQILSQHIPGVQSLRDISISQFTQHAAKLPPVVRNRTRHVITETQRVLDAIEALKNDDLAEFGELMNASHNSLQADYEVSCTELDTMVEIARSIDGTLGARMTGGGFGGCTVNLVLEDQVDSFCSIIQQRYQHKFNRMPDIYISAPSHGMREIS
ncbi:galactokinase [candidate division KSB1 bacterium]|nr:galactokinase [candidate division KSB1 bacterium]